MYGLDRIVELAGYADDAALVAAARCGDGAGGLRAGVSDEVAELLLDQQEPSSLDAACRVAASLSDEQVARLDVSELPQEVIGALVARPGSLPGAVKQWLCDRTSSHSDDDELVESVVTTWDTWTTQDRDEVAGSFGPAAVLSAACFDSSRIEVADIRAALSTYEQYDQRWPLNVHSAGLLLGRYPEIVSDVLSLTAEVPFGWKTVAYAVEVGPWPYYSDSDDVFDWSHSHLLFERDPQANPFGTSDIGLVLDRDDEGVVIGSSSDAAAVFALLSAHPHPLAPAWIPVLLAATRTLCAEALRVPTLAESVYASGCDVGDQFGFSGMRSSAHELETLAQVLPLACELELCDAPSGLFDILPVDVEIPEEQLYCQDLVGPSSELDVQVLKGVAVYGVVAFKAVCDDPSIRAVLWQCFLTMFDTFDGTVGELVAAVTRTMNHPAIISRTRSA
jgi:hypothetical protein